jgi:hypothetical protein
LNFFHKISFFLCFRIGEQSIRMIFPREKKGLTVKNFEF